MEIEDFYLDPEKERELVSSLYEEVDYDLYKEVFIMLKTMKKINTLLTT